MERFRLCCEPWERSPLATKTFEEARLLLYAVNKFPCELFENEVAAIQEHHWWEQPPSITGCPPVEPDGSFKFILGIKRDADQFVRYCLARLAGIYVDEEFEDAAKQEYRNQYAMYNAEIKPLIPEGLAEEMERLRYIDDENPTALDDWQAYLHRRQVRRAIPGLLTGLDSLDALLGGIRGLTLLSGPTNSGKSTLLQCLCAGVLREQKDLAVLALALETGKDLFFDKMLSMEAGVDYRTFMNTTWPEDPHAPLCLAAQRLEEEIFPRIAVVSRVWSGRGIKQKALSLAKQTKSKQVLILVDSIHQLPVHGPVISGSEEPEQRAILSDLEADDERISLLMELQQHTRSEDLPMGYPIVAVTRVTKTNPQDRLTLADVKGKADTVFNVDAVLLIQPNPNEKPKPGVTPTLISVAKVRDSGHRGEIVLDFAHTVSQFRERSGTPPPNGKSSTVSREAPVGANRFLGK